MEKRRPENVRDNLQLVHECWNLIWPKEADLADLPDDPIELMLYKHELSLAYSASLLGADHPITKELEKLPERVARFLPFYYRLVSDTLSKWPIRKNSGQALNRDETLLSVLKYSAAVSNRYAPILNVLNYLHSDQHARSGTEDFDHPFEYQINGQVRTFKAPTGHLEAKYKFFRNQPAFGYRETGIPFDMVILHPKPKAYLRELRQKGVFDYFQSCLDGSFSLPSNIQSGLRQLDYVMFHEVGVGNLLSACHFKNSTLDRGSGICLPTAKLAWYKEGKIAPGTSIRTLLAVPHETQHVDDDHNYPWGNMGEFVVIEIRAFHTETDTALLHGWQDDRYVQGVVNANLQLNHAILLGQWGDHTGLNHNDSGFINRTKELIFKSADHKNGAFLLAQTRKFLEGYLSK